MIEAVRHLGELALEEKELTEALTLPVPSVVKDKTQHVVELDLLTKSKQLKIHIPYQVDADTPLAFLWIGSADGPASLQWYGTTSNPEYLLSQTIPNLLKMWDQNEPFYEKLQQAFEHFFIDLQTDKPKEQRYRYVISPEYYESNITETSVKDAVKKEVTKGFHQFVKHQRGLTSSDIQLYTLAIDGERIVDQPFYRQLIIREKESVFDTAKEGICSATGKKQLVTGETAKLKFNYYITDKINFASNLEKSGYIKNMALGKEAYRQLMAGESYVLRNLYTRFAALPCYIVPEFLFKATDADDIRGQLDEWSEKIRLYIETAKTVTITKDFKRRIDDFVEEYEEGLNQVSLNLLFFTKAQASLKVNKLIQNVPIQFLARLIRTQRQARVLSERFYGEGNWNLGLEQIYYLIPMKNQGGDPQEKQKILSVYESLLLGKRISKKWLIDQFVHLAKIYHLEQFGSYQLQKVNNVDFHLRDKMLKCQSLLWMIDQLTNDKEGKQMAPIDYKLQDESVISYMKTMEYREAESAMFLLGYLIAEVAALQYRNQHQTKPILNKINYQGMNKTKVTMLSTDVFEKLVQLQKPSVTYFQEAAFAEHKRLFDEALKNWSMTDKETVFYILAGYAFGTQKRFQKNEKEEVVNE